MEPNLWGPDTWKFLHILTLKSQASYHTLNKFFYYLQYLLPCPSCRDNYQKHYIQNSFPKDKMSIPLWLVQFHNKVNKSINKNIEDETKMILFWKKQIKNTRTSKDIGIWTFIQCILHVHPGKYKISQELIIAHKFIWEHFPEILPKYLSDYTDIIYYLESHPINDVHTKYKYHNQVHNIFNKFHLIDDIQREKKVCMDYCAVNK
jgi:hypothetical protein